MSKHKYGWRGFKAPIFNLNDPDYCEYGCPVCTGARKGNRIALTLQRIEMAIMGPCWWGRARQRKYGVKPDEPLPKERD